MRRQAISSSINTYGGFVGLPRETHHPVGRGGRRESIIGHDDLHALPCAGQPALQMPVDVLTEDCRVV